VFGERDPFRLANRLEEAATAKRGSTDAAKLRDISWLESMIVSSENGTASVNDAHDDTLQEGTIQQP
jgi:hypothetical protein